MANEDCMEEKLEHIGRFLLSQTTFIKGMESYYKTLESKNPNPLHWLIESIM